MTLDEQFADIRDRYLACFRDGYGDAWHLAALDRSLYLHASARPEDDEEYLLLKQWVEDMVAAGVRAKEGQ